MTCPQAYLAGMSQASYKYYDCPFPYFSIQTESVSKKIPIGVDATIPEVLGNRVTQWQVSKHYHNSCLSDEDRQQSGNVENSNVVTLDTILKEYVLLFDQSVK